jgi:hypothetical protein
MNSEIKGPSKRKTSIAPGQLWRVNVGYVQITHLGKTLAEYKMFKMLGQKAVRSQMGGQEHYCPLSQT